MSRSLLVWIAVACGFVATAGPGQDEGEDTVARELLEILKGRGVISSEEFDRLSHLEVDLRQKKDFDKRVGARVDEMIGRLGDDAPTVAYKPGNGFTFKSANGNHALTIGGAVQVRGTYEARENENGVQNDKDLPNFNVQRAVLWFKGHAFTPNLKYVVQLQVAGDETSPIDSTGVLYDAADVSANRVVELEYGYFDWQICDYRPWFNLRGGQFKIPYSREWLIPYTGLQFVDRSVVSTVLAPQSSYGAMFWGNRGGKDDKLFEYYVGVFDGPTAFGVAEGENIPNNDEGLLYAGRVVVNPFGAMPYAESDLRPCRERDELKMAVGLNAFYHQDNNRSEALGNFDQWTAGADIALAWRGFYAYGEVAYRHNAQPNNGHDDVEAFGWNAQMGYMVVPQKFEIGIRYSQVSWDGTSGFTTPTLPIRRADREYLGVLGYYWQGHDMKLQLDFGRVELHNADGDAGPSATNIDEWRARMQFQIVF